MFLKYLEKPVRYNLLDKWLKKPSIKILDIGCGNHSASITKGYYPDSKYYGLDIDKAFNNNESDYKAMKDFYEVDLNGDLNLMNKIPDNFFDQLILSHIIEHLQYVDRVLLKLFPKLKNDGNIYIETPSLFTVKLPNMGIGLNFYSDPTHVEVQNIENIVRLLNDNGFTILRKGKRRSLKRIFFLPVYFFGSLFRNKRISPAVFWDLLGWSHYIIARKQYAK